MPANLFEARIYLLYEEKDRGTTIVKHSDSYFRVPTSRIIREYDGCFIDIMELNLRSKVDKKDLMAW